MGKNLNPKTVGKNLSDNFRLFLDLKAISKLVNDPFNVNPQITTEKVS
jgi:hypothetical protein